ncbi:hypothetical protein L1887_05773 [Cichorium endivia]|nr:hypothetical protein L1887_05773 [Cichorium endivia]
MVMTQPLTTSSTPSPLLSLSLSLSVYVNPRCRLLLCKPWKPMNLQEANNQNCCLCIMDVKLVQGLSYKDRNQEFTSEANKNTFGFRCGRDDTLVGPMLVVPPQLVLEARLIDFETSDASKERKSNNVGGSKERKFILRVVSFVSSFWSRNLKIASMEATVQVSKK